MNFLFMLEFKMIPVRITLLAVIFFNFFDSNEGCKYSKFTADHTGCKKPSPGCKISKTGLEDSSKSLLLKEHNEYRKKIATGKESRAGGMPEAADMLEMVWDEELAEVAQKHAEQCKFEHDCPKCREVDRFSVGQNMHIAWNSKDENNIEEFLKKGLKDFYDEVDFFKNDIVPSFKMNTEGKNWGHFTQMIWAESWKLGCGYVKYEDSEKPGMTTQFAVCNFGPGGNILNKPIYKAGKPASACPENSSKSENFPGLCKMKS